MLSKKFDKFPKEEKKMTQYEEQMIRQVVAGNMSKLDVLEQMIASGTIKTTEDYDTIARHIAYRVVMAKEWAEAGK
jgi:archaeosine-15-forming tRNA-guanine transglycosylase